MLKNHKPLLLSPLLGGLIAGSLLWFYAIYLIILELLQKNNGFSIISLLINSIMVLPAIIVLSLIISYFLFYPCLFIVEKLKNKFFLREGTTWAIMFLLGLIVGGSIAIWDYTYHHELIKAIIIIICLSFGLMFNMSLYSILNGRVKLNKK